jgi:hypothetical protein
VLPVLFQTITARWNQLEKGDIQHASAHIVTAHAVDTMAVMDLNLPGRANCTFSNFSVLLMQ